MGVVAEPGKGSFQLVEVENPVGRDSKRERALRILFIVDVKVYHVFVFCGFGDVQKYVEISDYPAGSMTMLLHCIYLKMTKRLENVRHLCLAYGVR